MEHSEQSLSRVCNGFDSFLNEAGRLLRAGDKTQAVQVAEQLLLLVDGMEDANTQHARGLDALGLLFFEQGLHAHAEPLIKRSLAIREKVLAPDNPDVATSLYLLATLHETQGCHTQAEPLVKRCLAIWEKVLGPEHPEVASCLNLLATLYDAQGQHAEAEPLHARSQAIWGKALGLNPAV